jgi:hypothetical protein
MLRRLSARSVGVDKFATKLYRCEWSVSITGNFCENADVKRILFSDTETRVKVRRLNASVCPAAQTVTPQKGSLTASNIFVTKTLTL